MLTLSIHAATLTALYIGDSYDRIWADNEPLSFRWLFNLKHLKIPVAGFLGDSRGAADGHSLPDERMRNRFPPSLQELVLLVYQIEESHILSALQHYIGAEPSILSNLKALHIHCHAPEAMYEWLREPTERHHIQLRIFRKLRTKNNYIIRPFAKSVGNSQQKISEVEIQLSFPSTRSQLEDLMLLEEYIPTEEIVVTSFEDDFAELRVSQN